MKYGTINKIWGKTLSNNKIYQVKVSKLFLVAITALALLMAFSYSVSASSKSAEESLKDTLSFENPLVDFSILEINEKSNAEQITVKMKYKDGEITEPKLTMKKVDGSWKLIIQDLTPEGDKTIKEGTKKEPDTNSDDVSTQGVSICNYSFLGYFYV